MHNIFDVEDSGSLNTLVLAELKKQGIKETSGRGRKPTRNNNNVTTSYTFLFFLLKACKYLSILLMKCFMQTNFFSQIFLLSSVS